MTLPQPRYESVPNASHFVLGELSILVFGPGRGEAIVVIFPDGHLGVVDGCREPTRGAADGTGDPVREFIRRWHAEHPQLGGRLRFVALTHPHDDHYAGLADLLTAYLGRIENLWSPIPTGDRYVACFRDYFAIERSNPDGVPDDDLLTGLTEFDAAFESCRAHSSAPAYKNLVTDRSLFERSIERRKLTIRSVAPDDGDLRYAYDDFADALQRATASADRTLRVRHNPNLTSGALVIRWGDSQVLLGGDLLCAEGKYKGWSEAERHVKGRVQVVKMAHHASAFAQEWPLLRRIQPALLLVTPFQEAKNNQPPKPSDISALLGVCPEVAVTSPPFWSTQGTRPQPRARTAARAPAARISRNRVLRVTHVPPPTADAIGVSLDAHGNITRVVLTGRADFYVP